MKYNLTYKNLCAWLLLVMYIVSPFRFIQSYINYSINYEFISTVLCENKNKPDMECKGKCQLNKDIRKKAEEESKKQPTLQNTQAEEIPSEKSYYSIPPFYLLKEISFSSFSEQCLSTTLNHITPPPKA